LQRLCCARELLAVAASVGTKIALLAANSTEPGDYATCRKATDYEQWLETMIKDIKKLERWAAGSELFPLPLNPGSDL